MDVTKAMDCKIKYMINAGSSIEEQKENKKRRREDGWTPTSLLISLLEIKPKQQPEPTPIQESTNIEIKEILENIMGTERNGEIKQIIQDLL